MESTKEVRINQLRKEIELLKRRVNTQEAHLNYLVICDFSEQMINNCSDKLDNLYSELKEKELLLINVMAD